MTRTKRNRATRGSVLLVAKDTQPLRQQEHASNVKTVEEHSTSKGSTSKIVNLESFKMKYKDADEEKLKQTTKTNET